MLCIRYRLELQFFSKLNKPWCNIIINNLSTYNRRINREKVPYRQTPSLPYNLMKDRLRFLSYVTNHFHFQTEPTKTKNNLVWTTRACITISTCAVTKGGGGGATGPYNLMKYRLRFLSYVTNHFHIQTEPTKTKKNLVWTPRACVSTSATDFEVLITN